MIQESSLRVPKGKQFKNITSGAKFKGNDSSKMPTRIRNSSKTRGNNDQCTGLDELSLFQPGPLAFGPPYVNPL